MTTNPNLGEITNNIIAFENGELNSEEIIRLFSALVKNGMAWSLQGSYGRNAKALIESGYIDSEGNINEELLLEVI